MSLPLGRFVDLVMGAGACAPKKLESGNPLVVLGVQAEVNLAGIVFTPSPAKIKEWVAQIKLYLRLGLISWRGFETCGATRLRSAACVQQAGKGSPCAHLQAHECAQFQDRA